MPIATLLARGRDAAERLMVDTCTITRPGPVVTNHLTGVVTPAAPVTVYTGPCKVQTAGRSATGRRLDAGEVSVVVLRLELHLPVATSVGVQRGDVVAITTAVNDPDLTSRSFLVHDLSHKTHATARRLQMEEAT